MELLYNEQPHQNNSTTNIQKFYNGCNVFITGATGFMGRILIEKLLRSTNVGAIYILIRPKKGKDIDVRLEEIFSDVVSTKIY